MKEEFKLVKFFGELDKNDALIAGGKGASLGEMTRAGIPVPPGFVLTAQAFERFIIETDIDVEIDSILHSVNNQDISTVEGASEKIRGLILNQEIPTDIASQIKSGFKELDAKFVAVRSSATAEDGAEHAWAGQLESYLNVTEPDVLEKVKHCWSSLFTPRAIFYRFEKFGKETHLQKISVAVVVQKMVESEKSGIAFSVHPVTEDHNQLIIEAGLGLGEAIVSGSITPDSYVVEKTPRRIIDKNVVTQTRGMFRGEKGGSEWRDVPKEHGEPPTLSDSQILELSNLVLKIENNYGFPCDIEWAYEAGKFYIVQSRPITTLTKEKKIVDDPLLVGGIKWFLSVTRNMSFWHQELANNAQLINLPDFGMDTTMEILTVTVGGTETHCFMHEPNYSQYAQTVLAAVNTKAKIAKLKERYELFARELLTALNQCKIKLTVETWQNFINNYTRFCAGLMPTATIGRSGGELLVQKLKAKGFTDNELPEIMAAITYPKEHTPLFNSQLDLLKIGAEIQNHKISKTEALKPLTGWLEKYQHIPVNWCEEPWVMNDAEAQLANALEKNCEEEILALKKSHEKINNQGLELLGKIKDEEIEVLALAIAEATYLNEFRKNNFSRVSLEYRPIFQKIAEMGGSNRWRDCFYLKPSEMTEILKGKKLSIPDIVKERNIVGIYRTGKVENEFLSHEETKKLVEYIKSLHGSNSDEGRGEKIVKGYSANKGKVRGVVKVVLNSKEFSKLLPGEILVTTMTSVDFVPVMERAAAFVTNEGGITSHASIVAREMGKPCIIGTKNATQILKDGDMVEVDADNGVVKIIK